MSARPPFLDELAVRARQLAADSPALTALRASAELGNLPSGKLETFKYTPVESLYDRALIEPQPCATATEAPITIEASFRIAAATGVAAGPLPEGVTVLPLSEAVSAGELNAHLDAARYPLTQLNTGLVRDGVVIRIERDQVIEPALLLDLTSVESGACTRVILDLEPGSALHLVEQHHQALVANRILDIRIGRGAQLNHLRWQGRSNCAAWHLTSATLDADATYRLDTYALGGAPHRNDYHVRLLGTGAAFDLNGVHLARAKDRLDQQVVVEHQAPDGRSRQTLHGIARDAAKLSFNGRIHIHPGAQRTDARLTNRNLQLDSRAQINTKPELEIYADDVQCAHGATVGQLDESALFYLRSRGIGEAASRRMLMRGFIRDCLPPGSTGEQLGELLGAELAAEDG